MCTFLGIFFRLCVLQHGMLTWGVKVHIMFKNKLLAKNLNDFLEWLKNNDHSPNTIKSYELDLNQFVTWIENIIPKACMADIGTLTLQQYRNHLERHGNQKTNKGLSASTINRMIQSLRKFLNWAYKKNLIERDPSQDLKLKTLQKNFSPKALDKAEIHKMLTLAGRGNSSQRNYALFQLLLQTGLRIGEVENLKLEDIYLYDRSGEIRVKDGKGRKERAVPLNSSVRKALKDYLQERKNKACEKKLIESNYVFVNSKETPLKKRALQKIISQIMKKAGIPAASAHTLRHTFATAHYNDHKKLVELSNLLGHSNLNTTARYTQASKEQLAEQLESSSLNEFGE